MPLLPATLKSDLMGDLITPGVTTLLTIIVFAFTSNHGSIMYYVRLASALLVLLLGVYILVISIVSSSTIGTICGYIAFGCGLLMTYLTRSEGR